jgi:ABC-type phosphate transport system auxiliary subunit
MIIPFNACIYYLTWYDGFFNFYGEMRMAKAKTKKVMVKTEKASDKLSKSLKNQVVALIEKANKATHKTLAKLEKQFKALNGKKASVKAKGATKAKKRKTSKKNTETSNQEA